MEMSPFILTLVLAIFSGVCLFVVSRYIKIPSIVLLLVGGVLLGPEVFGLIDPSSMGENLRFIISLSVAIILFEGGLTLHPEGMKKATDVILRLLTVGVLITWFSVAGLVYFLFDFSIIMSLLVGSLVIVTGPTVISPLLKRIKVKDNLYHILHWEGVLIDPIGVFAAFLSFELLIIKESFVISFIHLSYRLAVGGMIGLISGGTIYFLIKKELIPRQQINIFVFASALFMFVISDVLVPESGILTVVVAGLVLGWSNPPGLKHIKQFKSELTELAIALVFILLAANLKMEHFSQFGWKVVVLLLIVMFVIRPISIMVCSYKTSLTIKEKLFLSWVAPRGVVAGSMASILGVELISKGHPEAVFLETFTFSVIAVTIIFQGMTAGYVAKWLGVEEAEKKGWLIVGAHAFSIEVAKFITKTTNSVCVLVDTNADAIEEAQKHGLTVLQENALSTDILSSELVLSIGNLLALTDNRDLNQLICEKWSEVIDKNHLFRWSPPNTDVEHQIDDGMGIPIWFFLNKPSQVAYDLKNKVISFRHDNHLPNKMSINLMHLVAESQGSLFFAPAFPETFDIDAVFLLEKLTHHLAELVHSQHIFFLKATSYEDLLLTILKNACQLYLNLSYEELSKQLIERERNVPTVLSHGVMAPHIYCTNLHEPICFIARISYDIEQHTYEDDQVQLIFALLSPENDPEQYLRLLVEIANIASTPDIVQSLLEAKTADEIVQALT